jgi:pimeloyl-ACP methyl ester carboxylesterase
MNAVRALALLASVGTLACAPRTDLATLDARTLHAIEGGDALPMRATYFPSTAPRSRRRDVPLIVVEPLLFRRELLYANGGLIPYLASEGFPVWLVWVDAAPPDARTLARGIAATVASIARETGVHRFDVAGLSLGADATLRALETLTAPASGVDVRRVVFLGGGFDYAYPNSFASRVASLRGGPAAALCTLDGDAHCARELLHPDAAVPWLGALPAADDDALRPSRERFPFVARFTHLPVLFEGGKGDGIAPSESFYPLYTLWGSDQPDTGAVPKLFFLAGRENGLGWDFDAFDLLAGKHGPDAWAHVVAWLERGD